MSLIRRKQWDEGVGMVATHWSMNPSMFHLGHYLLKDQFLAGIILTCQWNEHALVPLLSSGNDEEDKKEIQLIN